MKTLNTISLKSNEKQALLEFKQIVRNVYPQAEIILFGSKARGDSSTESDIDLIVILEKNVTGPIEHELSILKFDIELKYDVVIGLVVENREFWQSPRVAVTPLHINVDREGVLI